MQKIKDWYAENVYKPMCGHDREKADKMLASFTDICKWYETRSSMKEQIFMKTLDRLWKQFADAVNMVNVLESAGLDVNPTVGEGKRSAFGGLYGIMNNVSRMVLDLIGFESDDALAAIDNFLFSIYDLYPDSETFPVNHQEELLELLRGFGAVIPWEQKQTRLHISMDRYRRHRALSVASGEPVTGYIWAGAGHTYIIPRNDDATYDEETEMLKAPAVRVDPTTVAVDMLFTDDVMNELFEGDTVRVGRDEFVLKLSDMDVLKKLTDPERLYKGGLIRVRKNYEK